MHFVHVDLKHKKVNQIVCRGNNVIESSVGAESVRAETAETVSKEQQRAAAQRRT